jgi:hypothetical protein
MVLSLAAADHDFSLGRFGRMHVVKRGGAGFKVDDMGQDHGGAVAAGDGHRRAAAVAFGVTTAGSK